MRNPELFRKVVFVMILSLIGGLAFSAGLLYSSVSHAAGPEGQAKRPPRVVYPKRSEIDFEGLKLQGEVRSPGEFYFQHRTEEKFDSLVKRRKNFHQEMLRDAVLSK